MLLLMMVVLCWVRVVMVVVVRRGRRVVVVVVVSRQWLRGSSGRGLGEVLVVVHPHLEDLAGHPDLVAERVDGAAVGLLDAPPDAVREVQHALLLIRGELCAEPLLAGRRRR
jgi:hypothetical protein